MIRRRAQVGRAASKADRSASQLAARAPMSINSVDVNSSSLARLCVVFSGSRLQTDDRKVAAKSRCHLFVPSGRACGARAILTLSAHDMLARWRDIELGLVIPPTHDQEQRQPRQSSALTSCSLVRRRKQRPLDWLRFGMR